MVYKTTLDQSGNFMEWQGTIYVVARVICLLNFQTYRTLAIVIDWFIVVFSEQRTPLSVLVCRFGILETSVWQDNINTSSMTEWLVLSISVW